MLLTPQEIRKNELTGSRGIDAAGIAGGSMSNLVAASEIRSRDLTRPATVKSRPHEAREPAGGGIPGGGVSGFVSGYGERPGDHRAGVGERVDPAPGHHL